MKQSVDYINLFKQVELNDRKDMKIPLAWGADKNGQVKLVFSL